MTEGEREAHLRDVGRQGGRDRDRDQVVSGRRGVAPARLRNLTPKYLEALPVACEEHWYHTLSYSRFDSDPTRWHMTMYLPAFIGDIDADVLHYPPPLPSLANLEGHWRLVLGLELSRTDPVGEGALPGTSSAAYDLLSGQVFRGRDLADRRSLLGHTHDIRAPTIAFSGRAIDRRS